MHAHTLTAHATHTPKAAPATRRSRVGMPSELVPADSMGLAVGDTSKGQTPAADAAQTPTPVIHRAQQDYSDSKGPTLSAEAAGDSRHGQQQGGSGYPAQLFAEFAGGDPGGPKGHVNKGRRGAAAGPVTPENEPRLVRSPLGARARRGARGERAVQELTPDAKPGLVAAVILAPLLSRSLALSLCGFCSRTSCRRWRAQEQARRL